MKATFSLDKENSRFIFEAEDFYLRFAIAPTIKSIDKLLSNDNGVLEIVCDGEEMFVELPFLTERLGIDWDFSKYEIEVI
ncbi:MAG: hypothetical protein FWG68_02665 [Defluviitaleaceae bacterium]|nr:hypothetical protein [Defluviitaleaceae bacterium]